MELLFFLAVAVLVCGVLFALDKGEHRANVRRVAGFTERLLIDYTNALRLRGHSISKDEQHECIELALESAKRESP